MLDFIVLAVGSLLHVAALPNEVIPDGWGWLGLAALVPVFWFTIRRSPGVSALGGALWILLVTLFSQPWLLAFHPLAFPIVLAVQMPWYAAAFAGSSWLWRRYPRSGLWFQALFWTAFEFIRIQGFFAYPYGSLASAFWQVPLAWQTADLIGVYGITFLLAWTSAFGAAALTRTVPWERLRTDLAVGIGLWTLDLGYGVFKWSSPETGTLWSAALVQQSQDPWKANYEGAFEALEGLSSEALKVRPDVVVWSETAFVPSVEYHKKYRDNPVSLDLVRRLESYLSSSSVPFLLGNDHREKAPDGTLKNYNAVLAWDGGWIGRYEKNRLVPFTESFPFKDQAPWVYRLLLDADTHFWEPGRDRVPLVVSGVRVGTPVCFEDSFPDGARAFNLAGARALANLTNDSWAPGTASRIQHLSLAVFRTVECGLPMVRAGNDGATVAVSARGEVLGRLPVGPPGFLLARVHLGDGTATVYSLSADWTGWALVLWASAVLAWPRRKRSIVDKGEQL